MNKEEIIAIIEGLMYIVGEEGVTKEQLSQLLELLPTEVQLYLDELQTRYASEEHGIEVVNYAEIYRFVTKTHIHEYAEKLFRMNHNNTLSTAAIETLAIIAYKQPITRVEIEEIRGVGCDIMLRKLQIRNLIKELGRSDAPGKPILYGVTADFLDVFKLVSLKELPELPNYDSLADSENLFD
ncbi:MAG: SMC-Scp complex subunit ScpB [Erysipelotrichaceae bacterium]|nr:SMC-Scp complex subunit ScpB [Erysipelotrichaceae bacterium]MDD4642138.1 SMC-Scp complex subunit ScpB [Erysipelotrichaceae bacterium]